MQLVEDRWLGERFGHPVFTLTADGDPEAAAQAIIDHAREAGTASYQARVPDERKEVVAALTGAGFQVVNETITLVRDPDPIELPPDATEVRPANPETDGVVPEIAARSFTKSRFHVDPAIPRRVADRVKRDWAENSLRGARGDGMLVAVRDGEVVGFLAGLSRDEGGRTARVIDLIAVDSSARDAGAGRALVSRFAEESREGYDELRVGSQAANADATRFYERLGFTRAATAFDLHLHVGRPWSGA